MKKSKSTIHVHIDNGVILDYDVLPGTNASNYANAITKGGYNHIDGETFEYYPPHRIVKVSIVKYNY